MAISLVIDPSISPCFSFSASSSSSSSSPSPSRSLPLRSLHFHGRSSSSPLNSKPNQGLYLSPITMNTRGSYVASLQASPRNEANSKHPADVKSLIRVYKQALLEGDEITVSEIETVLRRIEKEKNKMDQKVLSLSMKIASEKEAKIRLQADFDNTRKKLDKDKLSTESNAKVQIMKSLLPIIDSFESARQQIKLDTEKEKKIDMSYQGIYRQFVEVLRHLRLAAIATVGKPFDPLLHEAISREESETVKAGLITEELNRGFILGDRVLRPAKVKVSLGPINKKNPSPVEETTPSAGGADVRILGIDTSVESGESAARLGFWFKGFLPQTKDLLNKRNVAQYQLPCQKPPKSDEADGEGDRKKRTQEEKGEMVEERRRRFHGWRS